MALSTLKSIFIGCQIAGASLALIATIGNLIVSKKIETLAPYYQKIKLASATVEVFIESPEILKAHFMDQGGYFGFGKGEAAILLVSSIDSFGHQMGDNTIRYRGVFSLDISDPGFDMPLINLQRAEFAEIQFSAMPDKCKVIRGSVACLINGNIQLDLNIPPQQIDKKLIVIPKVNSVFSKFPPLPK